MLHLLIERENEEMLRPAARTLKFPDGEVRRVETYKLIWSWFDRCEAYEFTPDTDELLDNTLKCMELKGIEAGEALEQVVCYIVLSYEHEGLDITDDNIDLLVARRQMSEWHARKSK